jgi:hypothetical protein
MVDVFKCPKCGGTGCDFCGGTGFIAPNPNSKVSGMGKSNNLSVKAALFFKEPHDFIWAVKKKNHK